MSVYGIVSAELQGENRILNPRHSWHSTQKISYNKRRFSVLPKSEVGLLKQAKQNYFTDSYRKWVLSEHKSSVPKDIKNGVNSEPY